MKRLQPDSRGVFSFKKQKIHHSGNINAYIKPNPSLTRLDNLIEGKRPRICITRKQGGIGDVLMTTPTVQSIAEKYQVKIDYGTDFDYLDGALKKVLLYNPHIEKILHWRDVDAQSYDAVIDLTCPCIAHEKPLAKPINRVDLFANHARIHLSTTDLYYHITDKEKKWAQDYLEEKNLDQHELVLVQPASSSLARDMPVDKLKRSLIAIGKKRRDIRFLLITHGSDNRKEDWGFGKIHQIHNFDVRQIAALMSKTKLVICPDSAILHVAAALHHPTFTIFGPTDPYARVNYHPEAVAYWPAKELRGYPTWYEAPLDGYLCWRRIEEEVVVNSVLSMLDETFLPSSREFVTFGESSVENKIYEIV